MDPEQSCLDSAQQAPQMHWKRAACFVSTKESPQTTEASTLILTDFNCLEEIYTHYTNHQCTE
eukprot:89113-Ditylum_brightwellii.AAC.1